MPFQTPITIREAIEHIHRREYFLPAIQRSFVWEIKQITKLFDSLMRDYPIGSFLFWQVSKEHISDFKFYEFIKDYNEDKDTRNPPANNMGEEAVTAILDGQQRLTSLYIALKGTYAFHKGRGRASRPCVKRRFFVNIATPADEDSDKKYEFDFLSPEESKEREEDCFWFEVGKIFEFNSLSDINRYLKNNDLADNDFAEKTLCCLFQVLTQNTVINPYIETSQELDKVLKIFERINSGGTELSHSDLLLSIATSQWKNYNAREEINDFVDYINDIDEGFCFDKDLVMKSCLVLNDLEVAFKVDNFNRENTQKIEDNWDEVKKSLRLAIELVAGFGYNAQTLTSSNAVIPIAYYIKLLGSPDNFTGAPSHSIDRARIGKWLTLSLVKKVFSGQSDNILRQLRKILQDNNECGFPFDSILKEFNGTTKTLSFTDDDIESLIMRKYGRHDTFSVLLLLYPQLDYRNKFHQDHIFPQSWFEPRKLKQHGIPADKRDFYKDNYNFIGNLQLMEGPYNEAKSDQDFSEWLCKSFKDKELLTDYKRKNLIPEKMDLSFTNFEAVFTERENLIRKKLKSVLLV
ncbi:MAG: DUF262 domain-containing protein [Parcubacteria group bacterium]